MVQLTLTGLFLRLWQCFVPIYHGPRGRSVGHYRNGGPRNLFLVQHLTSGYHRNGVYPDRIQLDGQALYQGFDCPADGVGQNFTRLRFRVLPKCEQYYRPIVSYAANRLLDCRQHPPESRFQDLSYVLAFNLKEGARTGGWRPQHEDVEGADLLEKIIQAPRVVRIHRFAFQ